VQGALTRASSRAAQLQVPPALAGKKYVTAMHISLFAADDPTVVYAARSFT
jgi:hypothetical protein